MSFFDEITQPTNKKKEATSSFFPSNDTSIKSTVKTPVTTKTSQSTPSFSLPTQPQSISFGTPSPKVQTSTPMFSSPIKTSLPTSTTPFATPPANASFFDKIVSEQKQSAPQKQESFFDTILKKPAEIYSAKPQSKLSKIFDEKAPKIIKDIASQISEGLYGTGQQVDFVGNLKEDKGLISGLFGSVKSDYARVGDRYDKLIEKGVTPERATSIATQYTKNSLSNPLAYINKKKIQDETIKNLNLTSEEKTALRTVGFFETINTALDSLNFTGIGSIGKKTFQTIAKETYPLAIKNILKKEIANIPESTADQLSRILAKVNDEDAVEKIISKVDFSINKYKPPAPIAEEPKKKPFSFSSNLKKNLDPELELQKADELLKKAQDAKLFGRTLAQQKEADARAKLETELKKLPVYEGEKDLTISTLEKLKGRSSVSKQFISDLSNASDLKQTERDIIRETLDSFPEGSVIPVKEFAEKVKTGLLPLKVASPESMARYETITLPEEQRGLVDSYYENIYDSPIKTSAGNIHFGESPMGDEGGVENYFGHTRIEDMADNNTRRVIEVQSDLYQKGGLEREATINPKRGVDADQLQKLEKLQQYSNPTAHFRMVREEIKKAAQDGKTKLQFPTGETAIKIEGLGDRTNWRETVASQTSLVYEDLKPGKQIYGNGSNWVVTDILGDGKFKAVSKDFTNSYKADWGMFGDWEVPLNQKAAFKRDIESAKETFDISSKVDTNNPIYRFYEKDLGRYLTSKYQAKLVTDKQGVKWYEVDVKPEEAKKPVTAFKKPLFSKLEGPKVTIEEAKAIIFKDIPQKDIRLIFTDKLIDGTAIGQYRGSRDGIKDILKPVIELYEEGGKVGVKTALHESGHYFFDNFLTDAEKKEAFDIARKEISIKDRANYFVRGYKGEEKILEEYLVDKYAEQKAKEEGFHGPLKSFFERIDAILKGIVDTIKKVFDRIQKIPNRQGGFAAFGRKGNKAEYDIPLSKEEKLAEARKALKAGEKKYKVEPVDSDTFQILTNSKEDRLLIEKGLREMNRISKRESFLQSLRVNLPKELEIKATELVLRKEALDENPLKGVVKYMARRGEFKGGLPEVTGEGPGTFSKRGDDILTETTGIDDTEKARNAFDTYIKQKRTWEDEMIEFQKEKKAFLEKARGRRDTIIEEKKVEKATLKTEKHISELVDTDLKKKAHIERAKKALDESREKLKNLEDLQSRYRQQVEKAHLDEAQKKTILSKLKAIFSPIEQTDAVTKQIYLDWETGKLKAKESANKIHEQFKGKDNNDFGSLVDYEAGSKTPWIKEAFDDLFTEAKREGLDIGYKEDYIPHVYNEKPEVIKKAVVKYMEDQRVAKEIIEEFKKTGEIPEVIAIRLKIRPNFQKIRTFPDYRTAMKYNLSPKFSTVAEHLAYYREEMGKTLSNQKMIDDLIAKGKVLDAYDAPESWIEVKLPGRLRRTYYAQPNLANALNGQFRDEENLTFGQEFHKRLGNLAKLAQTSVLTGGVPETTINNFAIGQAIRMLTTGVGEASKLNLGGASTSIKAAMAFIRANFTGASIKWFKDNQKYIDLMSENNVPLMQKSSDYDQSYRTWRNMLSAQNRKSARNSLKEAGKDILKIRGPQSLGTAFKSLFDSRAIGISSDLFNKTFSDKTFMNMMPQMQIQVFKDIYEGAVKAGLPEATAAEFAGKTIKNEFGVINDLGRTQNVKDVFNSFFFAPRFREGMINIFVNGAKAWTTEIKNPTFARSRSLIVGMFVTYIIYDYLNRQLNNGDDMWDNEPGREFALKIPLPNGKIIYTDFMPSSLAFIRNIGSGGLAFLKGDSKTATQKFGTIFSIPVKIATEIAGNKDYFGRPIYELADTVKDKVKKSAEHIGLGLAHPYIRELVKYFEDKQDIYQTISMMMELPLKFSNEEKSLIAREYEAKAEKTALNARERNKIEDTIAIYDKVQELKAEGNIEAVRATLKDLSNEEKQEYQTIEKYNAIQALIKAKDKEQAQEMGNALSTEEKLQYTAIKTIRTSQKRSDTVQKKVDTKKKPAFDANTELDERTILESVKVYANAIGSDPITAFNRIFTGQRIRRVDNNTIIVERIPLFESAKIKKERGATADLKLDHTLPLSLGGDNSDSNLKLIPTEVWKSYTPVENHLFKLLKGDKISKQEAQSLIIKFKNKEITAEDILKL